MKKRELLDAIWRLEQKIDGLELRIEEELERKGGKKPKKRKQTYNIKRF